MRWERWVSPWPIWGTWASSWTAIPVETMNTSMTINATAAWLLGLYIAHAENTGVDPGCSRERPRTTS